MGSLGQRAHTPIPIGAMLQLTNGASNVGLGARGEERAAATADRVRPRRRGTGWAEDSPSMDSIRLRTASGPHGTFVAQ